VKNKHQKNNKNQIFIFMMESKGLRFMTHQSIFTMVGSGDLDGLKKLLEKLKNEDDDNSNNGSSSSSSPMSFSDVMSLQNDHGETPIYIAANHNLKEVFTFLLKLCDFEILKIRSKSDMNAFHVAAKRGHLGILYIYSYFSFLLVSFFALCWVYLVNQILRTYVGYCYYWIKWDF
jgi:ankyrin repeat protein